MAKSKGNGPGGALKPDVQLDSHFSHPERVRQGYVQGAADLPYGAVDGFRTGITSTGMRHKQSGLGRRVRGSDD